jgi:hypothetical protein
MVPLFRQIARCLSSSHFQVIYYKYLLSLSLSMLDKGSLKLPLYEEQSKLSRSHL